MNRRNISISISLIFLTYVILACGLPLSAPDLPPASTAYDELIFQGLWMVEGPTTELLVFTEKSLYRVASNSELGQVNEQFAEIVSYDESENHITLRTMWIKVNGMNVGFDAPIYTLTYKIDGVTLQIGRGTDTEFSIDLDPIIYVKK